VIDSVTEPFCASCDRIRLTAEGKLRACLFATDEIDLRPVLRGGGSDDDLARILADTVIAKGPGHQIGQVAFVRPRRSMSQIGG
jgi:cyclic pyranopterin phosphate synthase